MKLLDQKVALVTGGSRGIGAAIVDKLAQQGANIAFTCRSISDAAEAVAEKARQYGVTVKIYASDASSFEATDKLVQSVVQDFGKIDILVNNAGITRDGLLLRMTEAQWDEVIDNNLKSVFNFCKSIMKPMMKARGGSIINITSVVGVFGNGGQTNYAASKAGMIGFTKSLAQEMGSRNIRCNAIAPGFIDTDMTAELDEKVKALLVEQTALKRLGRPEEIANTVLFLASDMSSYITGEVLLACGGMH